MTDAIPEILLRIVAALVAGLIVGYERSYHGRPAGFRTHALVCMASSLLMLVTVYESQWVRIPLEGIRLDPTRMAQGIMTGIGFLGAGVIMKEGLSIRGLTTAASIWITAAIGILAGTGLYLPMGIAVALTLGVLAIFRRVEDRLPAQTYYYFSVSFQRNEAMPEEDLRTLIEKHRFSITNFAHRLEHGGKIRRYRMMLRTVDQSNVSHLASALEAISTVSEFRITPSGH